MSDGPIWFAPKRYGYGAGLPVSWQGWLVIAIFTGVTIAAAIFCANRPLLLVAILAPAVILLWIITARTTRGGWRWRWGGDED